MPSLSGQQSINPFDSLNDLLHQKPSRSLRHSPGRGTPGPSSPRSSVESHSAILEHYQQCLSSLVSCDSSPNAFDAFISLAKATSSTPAGQGLHSATLAWAGRHMVNQGQYKYEAISERLGSEASQIIMAKVDSEALLQSLDGEELMTLFAGLLMLVQFKVSTPFGCSLMNSDL